MLNTNRLVFCALAIFLALFSLGLTGCSQKAAEVSTAQNAPTNSSDPQNSPQGQAMRKSLEARQQNKGQ